MSEETYSYSKLDTFEQCPYKYKLIYLDGHRIKSDTIATELGTAIHATEETIGKSLIKSENPDYVYLINELEKTRYTLKERYLKDFYALDKSGRTYDQKIDEYINKGIYRLEKRLKENPYQIVGLEKEFFLEFGQYTFHGFIDRIFFDKVKNEYIIEDIKTYPKAIQIDKLRTPLQHVIYTLALRSIVRENIRCTYDLPFCDLTQNVLDGYLNRGINKLHEIFGEINTSDFHPNPTPLCHWCVFSGTYPDQPDEAKNLCPFYSLWTREHKTKEVNEVWVKN